MTEWVLGIDPGKSTGWASLSYDDTTVELYECGHVLDGLDGFLTWYNSDEFFADQIVFERFTLRSGNKFVADTTPLLIEGAMRGVESAFRPGYPIAYQTPSDKALVPDAALKRAGWWPTGKEIDMPDADDARDAIRHAAVWLIRQKHRPTIERVLGV